MRVTIFNLGMLLMQCVCLIGKICRPLFRHRHSLFSDTLARCFSAFLPLFQPPSIPLSLHPSLARWPLPACSPQGKLPQLRNAVRLHCNAPLCPASLHPYSTHIWTHTNIQTYTVDMHSHTHEHSCTQKTPSHTHKDYTLSPSPPLALPLHQTLLRLILLTIVLPP